MKRKRGHKKGNKSKKSKSTTEQPTKSAENQTSDQSSGGPTECENSEHEAKTEADAPSSTGSGNSPVPSSPVATASADNNMMAKSVGRVKVKLKSSKAPEPDVSPRTDAVKSSPKLEPAAVAVEKKDDLVPRLPERKPVFLNVYRKTKGIKIKSSKMVDGSSSVTEKSSDAVKAPDAIVLQKDTKMPDVNLQTNKQDPESALIPYQKEQEKADQNLKCNKQEPESVPVPFQKEQKKADQNSLCNKQEPESVPVPFQKEQKKRDQNSQYNKQELEDSLTVIKKIMKMDAADPFNVPVNPEALGIPDYFDIIKTPMDFGTICNNFEKGNKYMNSEDVYKDVQYIWNNCSKYNKKGDYIVDLMKRVKKNFMKYWTAAGLYTEQSADNAQPDDGGKASSKGSQAKQKSHKRHGRHHKSDCMCAICILKRRKRERERGSPGHSGAKEESSPVGSPSIDNSSINMGEEQEMDIDVDNKFGQGKSEIVELDSPVSEKQRVTENKQEVDEEEEEEENHEVESENRTKNKLEDKTQSIDMLMEESGDEPVTIAAEKLVVLSSDEGPKSNHNEEEKENRLQEQKKLQELERKEWRAKMHEKFQVRNPQLLSLCNVLFPKKDNHSSVWSGPHSMFKSGRGLNRTSSLHKAVENLMK